MIKKFHRLKFSMYYFLVPAIWTLVIGFVAEIEMLLHTSQIMPFFFLFWLLGTVGLILTIYIIKNGAKKLTATQYKLINSSKRYQRLTNLAFEGLIIHDKGTAVDVNSSLCDMLGYTHDELIGINFIQKIIAEESQQLIIDRFQTPFATPYEIQAIRKDGSRFTAEIESRLEHYEGRELRVASFKDIDYKKKVAAELLLARQKLELHMDNTPLAVLEWDVNFNVTRWNKAAENIFGYREAEVLGRHSAFILTPEVQPIAEEIWANLMKQTGGTRSTNQNITKNGTVIWCEWFNTPLKNEKGEVIGVASLVQNISKRKAAEEALLFKNHELESAEEELRASNEELVATNDALKNNMHEVEAAEEEVRASLEEVQNINNNLIQKEKELQISNHMLQLVIDHIPQRVFWKDLESRYLGCNSIFAQDAGCKNTLEAKGKTNLELYSPALALKYQGLDQEVLDSGVPKLHHEEIEGDLEKAFKVFKTNRVPIKDEQGKVMGLLGMYEDITALKKMQQELITAKTKAEESDKLKSSFLANMSHEIRTPMNGIIGFSQLLALKTGLDNNLKEYVDIIVSSGEQLLSIVDDILNISKIETGQVTLYQQQVDINSLLHKMLPIFELKAQSRNNTIKLHTEFSADETMVETDATKLRQVISNLLTNALKFTQNGTIEFGCSRKKDMMQFYVKDTGRGISKEKTTQIFDRFSQLGATAHENHGGVGLGLSISKGLVHLMGGDIWVDSAEGVGSTFYFTIPHKKYSPTIAENQNSKTEVMTDKFNLSGVTILVAEDDITNHKVIEYMLLDSKAKLIKAYNGKEAIEKITTNPGIDLVLMDIKMPILNGFDAALEIKSINPHIPIIAQTAFALDENREEFMDARFENYLAKPLDRNLLLEVIVKTVCPVKEKTL